MKATMATTLIMANQNSNSPNDLTLARLTTVIATAKMRPKASASSGETQSLM